jgi:hypothetical protein
VAFAQQQAALQVSMSHEQLAFGAFNTLYYYQVAFIGILLAARHSVPTGAAAATTATTVTALVDAPYGTCFS